MQKETCLSSTHLEQMGNVMKEISFIAIGLATGVIVGILFLSSDTRSSNLDVVQFRPQPLTSPSANRDRKIVCNRFVLKTTENGSTVNLVLETDLPGDAIVMVSVSRSYWEKGSPEEYRVEYLSERSTVGNWITAHKISIADELWNSKLLAKQKEMASLGLGFDVASISDEIKIRMVVPINQPDPRFGRRNEHLVGTAVRTTGLRIVQDETVILRPLQTRTRKTSPFANRKSADFTTHQSVLPPKQPHRRSSSGLYVNRDQFGDKWPFTISEGYVESINYAVVFHTIDGKTYALNGIAKGKGYHDIGPIWRPDPLYSGQKISVGPLIDLGIKQRGE